jgi:hypothetical protein
MIAGAALIVIGLLLFWAERIEEGISQGALFFLIGSVFLGAYLYRREYGFLIPACILLGLGFWQVASRALDVRSPLYLGLGCGFVAIFVVARVYEKRSDWWPLIPGGILLVMAFGDLGDLFEYFFEHWPLALVVIGVLIVLGGFRQRRADGRADGGG